MMSEQSLGCNWYYIVFKDDLSKYVFILKEKSEIKYTLAQFHEINTAGHSFKELLIDDGGESNNYELHKITQEFGLSHRMTIPTTTK